ncbi:P-type conjugative transfer protein TrbJ [Herbaspirillum huttiense]|uniref:P-type conjugative transfer protein TrbJ n=1 Tax=Herbaspirillum huttiense TaxID=863372 RepID=UPI00381232A9
MAKKFLFSAMLVIATQHAVASGMIAGATEPTQIANNVQLALSYAEHLQQTATQLRQYQTMLTNLEKMVPSGLLDSSAQKLFNDMNMNGVFNNLRTIVVLGQKLAYSSSQIDEQFRRANPGYGNYSSMNYGQAYKDWNDNTFTAIQNSTKTVAVQSEDLASESGLISQLATSSSTATGQMAAIQAGNQVGIAMVGQLQKLRQLQMAQMDAQNRYSAGQMSENTAKQENMDKWINSMKDVTIQAPKTNKGWFK